MATNWWINNQGVNTLRGVHGDPTNPPIFPDDWIVNFLIHLAPAKKGFRELVPLMLPAEQERLYALVEANPRTLEADPDPDPQVIDDRFMASQNAPGVHDANRRWRR